MGRLTFLNCLSLQKKGFTIKALKPASASCTQQEGILKNLDVLELLASASLPVTKTPDWIGYRIYIHT